MIEKPTNFCPINDNGKLVKTRKEHRCYFSERRIEKGEYCESCKVMPNSSTGGYLGINKPKTYYFCHTCGKCTH